VKSSYAKRSGSTEEGGGGRTEGTRRAAHAWRDLALCTVDPREEDGDGRAGGWRGSWLRSTRV
jgi:hypothetical protein